VLSVSFKKKALLLKKSLSVFSGWWKLKIVAFFSPVYKLANSFFGGRGNTGV
jgi:hypothetical protein